METAGAFMPFTFGEPKPDIQCPHCGKTLRQIVHIGPEEARCYTPQHEDCGCSGAAEQRLAEAMEQERRAEKRKRRDIQALVDASGIPKRYQNAVFTAYQVPPGSAKLYRTAYAYAERFGGIADGMGLYLTGGCGVGKTHIATAIALHLIEQERRVICMNTIELLARIRGAYTAGETEQELLRDYLRAELLILDDLGKESITDWSLQMLYTLVDMRYSSLKPMIVTTNYTDGKLIKRLARKGDEITAQAIVSRLHEVCHTVDVTGEDYRTKREIAP